MSSSSSRPIWRPSFDFGTVVIVSTIKLDAERSPLRSEGRISIRKSGAFLAFDVKEQIVMDSVASKLSSCTMTVGRGFPA